MQLQIQRNSNPHFNIRSLLAEGELITKYTIPNDTKYNNTVASAEPQYNHKNKSASSVQT